MSAPRQLSTVPAVAADGLRVVVDGGILRITIDRPDRMNALDLAHMTALGDVLEGAPADPAVRVVVLSGAGAAFCTGADLAAAAAAGGREAPPERADRRLDRQGQGQGHRADQAGSHGDHADGTGPGAGPRKAGQTELLQSPDFAEGVTAMLTKRAPNFGS